MLFGTRRTWMAVTCDHGCLLGHLSWRCYTASFEPSAQTETGSTLDCRPLFDQDHAVTDSWDSSCYRYPCGHPSRIFLLFRRILDGTGAVLTLVHLYGTTAANKQCPEKTVRKERPHPLRRRSEQVDKESITVGELCWKAKRWF